MKAGPDPKRKFSGEAFAERFRLMKKWAEGACNFARALDWLGDAKQYPEGSEEWQLAQVRDQVDFDLDRCCVHLTVFRRARAEFTHCEDLMIDVTGERMGDGSDFLHLLRRYHKVCGNKTEANGEVGMGGFPEAFAWDVYERVSALSELASQFPKQIQCSAREMHGWPMIVSHHLDFRHEFERLAELLEVGAEYPLDVGPRQRRGSETRLLRYLDPLVYRLHVLRKVLIETEQTRGHEDFKGRLSPIWWDYLDKPPTPEVVAILKEVPALPPLTQKEACKWSSEVIVPIIMAEDAGTAETCKIQALRSIWNHKSVKSRATFQSHLHSAVTDTLQRFARRG